MLVTGNRKQRTTKLCTIMYYIYILKRKIFKTLYLGDILWLGCNKKKLRNRPSYCICYKLFNLVISQSVCFYDCRFITVKIKAVISMLLPNYNLLLSEDGENLFLKQC